MGTEEKKKNFEGRSGTRRPGSYMQSFGEVLEKIWRFVTEDFEKRRILKLCIEGEDRETLFLKGLDSEQDWKARSYGIYLLV